MGSKNNSLLSGADGRQKHTNQETFTISLHCPRYKDDNPYYCSNTRLHNLTGAVQSLLKEYSGRIVRVAGGHRAQLKNNCEAVVEIQLSKNSNLTGLIVKLENIKQKSQVYYRVADHNGEEV